MLKLIAHAPEDGWAFVRDGESILLLRPPYRGNRVAVQREDVERAVTVHGYLARDLDFTTERDLVQYLRDEVVRSWPAQEDPEALREDLLSLADPDEINVYLDEATAWLRDGRRSEAITLSSRLLAAKELTHAQRSRIALLLEEARSQEEALQRPKNAQRQAQVATRFLRARASGLVGGAGSGVFCPAA